MMIQTQHFSNMICKVSLLIRNLLKQRQTTIHQFPALKKHNAKIQNYLNN